MLKSFTCYSTVSPEETTWAYDLLTEVKGH